MYNQYAQEVPSFESEQFEYDPQEYGGNEAGGLFSAEQEAELAQELLSVNSEDELNQWLSSLIRRAGGAVGSAVNSPTGQAIGNAIKGVAKDALKGGLVGAGKSAGTKVGGKVGSIAGGALGAAAGQKLGSYLGGGALGKAVGQLGQTYGAKAGDWLGSTVGGSLGSAFGKYAAGKLGLNTEVMEQEDLEFLGAQHFVRMAGEIAGTTLQAGKGSDPRAVAQAATGAAVRQYLPGWHGAQGGGGRQSGRWVRQGNRITLYGV